MCPIHSRRDHVNKTEERKRREKEYIYKQQGQDHVSERKRSQFSVVKKNNHKDKATLR